MKRKSMKIAVSTLGCPEWTLEQIIDQFPKLGIEGIDFRGTAEGLDITTFPAFTTDLQKTATRIKDAGLLVTGISTSIRLAAPEALEANLEEAKRTIPVAAALNAKKMRIFAAGPLWPDGSNREELASMARKTLDKIVALPNADEFNWLLETHDHWISPDHVKQIIGGAQGPVVGVLWDIAHTEIYTDVSVEDVCKAFDGSFNNLTIQNIHIRDTAVNDEGEKVYALPGQGIVRLFDALSLLVKQGYDGPITQEHEKRWNRDLADPEEVFPYFVQWAREVREKVRKS